MIVLAVPYGALRAVLSELGETVDGKVLVDVTNPLNATYTALATETSAAELAASLGYRPIDVGELRMARYLEGMAFLNIKLNVGNGWSWQSAWKLVGPTA